MTPQKPMTGTELYRSLKKRGACKESLRWVWQNRGFSAEELWKACTRGDWMRWILFRFWITERCEAIERSQGLWIMLLGRDGTKPQRLRAYKQIANIVRRHIKWSDVEAVLRA